MRADRNEADVAMALTPRLVVRPDDGETCVLARRSRVGLQRARMEASDLAQVSFELLTR